MASSGRLHDFYLLRDEWPRVYTQGQVLNAVPRVLIALSDIPRGGTPSAPVDGPANYCHTRAIIISPTCNIPFARLIQFASVEPAPALSKSNRKEFMQGRNHRRFLLPNLNQEGDHVVQLTDVWSLPREHFARLDRVACLSAWAVHLLADALYRAFARPISPADCTYDITNYQGCLPNT